MIICLAWLLVHNQNFSKCLLNKKNEGTKKGRKEERKEMGFEIKTKWD